MRQCERSGAGVTSTHCILASPWHLHPSLPARRHLLPSSLQRSFWEASTMGGRAGKKGAEPAGKGCCLVSHRTPQLISSHSNPPAPLAESRLPFCERDLPAGLREGFCTVWVEAEPSCLWGGGDLTHHTGTRRTSTRGVSSSPAAERRGSGVPVVLPSLEVDACLAFQLASRRPRRWDSSSSGLDCVNCDKGSSQTRVKPLGGRRGEAVVCSASSAPGLPVFKVSRASLLQAKHPWALRAALRYPSLDFASVFSRGARDRRKKGPVLGPTLPSPQKPSPRHAGVQKALGGRVVFQTIAFPPSLRRLLRLS